jgi:hypothetical protein
MPPRRRGMLSRRLGGAGRTRGKQAAERSSAERKTRGERVASVTRADLAASVERPQEDRPTPSRDHVAQAGATPTEIEL